MKYRRIKRRSLFESILNEDQPYTPPTNTYQTSMPLSDAYTNTSVDQNIDKYLVRYEREAVPAMGQAQIYPQQHVDQAMAPQMPMESRRRSLSSILFEQDDDDDLDLGDDDDFDLGGDDDFDLGGDDDFDLGGDDDFGGGGGGFDFGGGGGGGGGGGSSDGGGGAGDPDAAAQSVMNVPQININEFARAVARLVANYDALLDPRTTILNRAALYVATNYNERVAKELMQILEVNYQLVPNTATNSNVSQPDEFPTPYTVGAGGG